MHAIGDAYPTRREVGTLVVLGDSTSVGLGDPLPGGGWRGFGPLLAEALGAELANLSFTGARICTMRSDQLPQAVLLRPDAVVVVAGMNDTMRADFDPARLRRDLDHVVGELQAAGAVVVLARYHDHARVFRLPGPIRRALRRRITDLNAVVDRVIRDRGAACLDLDALPGAYEVSAWSVDRLHPSELGHRLLARGFAEQLALHGVLVPGEVSTQCSGGRKITMLHHVLWLVFKGIPWLWRRGTDLVPYVAGVLLRSVTGAAERPVVAATTTVVEPEEPIGQLG
ncbi:SGNH/GDSL hydrolase family protein [Kutzneria viridogrisea]|uniref:Lipolytic enzyme, G-D-S-L n=1 Tax=Kutzneria albida DSM 43870 TaxID=1449976 RepID=W5W593_9PSEU|nr:lipolytic enzyme, G-D-S-L [Kutzneria albida DSM 43870]